MVNYIYKRWFVLQRDLYCVLTAVRNGDLKQFGRVLDEYGTKFQAEKTYTLIVRLRHNVWHQDDQPILLKVREEGSKAIWTPKEMPPL